MNSNLDKVVDSKHAEDLLFDEKYHLEFKYSFWGYIRLIFGMTSIPTEIVVLKNNNKDIVGTIKEDDILASLAY